MTPPKRPVGRPKGEKETEVISFRIPKLKKGEKKKLKALIKEWLKQLKTFIG